MSCGLIHEWFELTYSNYLVLPRSLMQEMPEAWQERMVACLNEMREATRHLKVNDNYTVLLKDKRGRFVTDPFAAYRHTSWPLNAIAGPSGGAQ